LEYSRIYRNAGIKILFDTAGAGKRSEICGSLEKKGVKAEDIDILVLSHSS
jgi:metal-dependent hydrolase (beta-lactamase superfamily II)